MGRMKEASAQLLPCEQTALQSLRKLAEQHPLEDMRRSATRFAQQIENAAVERYLKEEGTRLQGGGVWTSRV